MNSNPPSPPSPPSPQQQNAETKQTTITPNNLLPLSAAKEAIYAYIEVAHNVTNRNKFIKLTELSKWQTSQPDTELYRSYFHYPTDDPNIGGLFADFGFDFDDKEKPERAQKEALRVINYLMNVYGILEQNISIYFSGQKGFHIWINHHVLDVKPHFYLPQIYKLMAKDLTEQHGLKTLDLSIYDRRRLIRLPNTKHQASQLYKIPLTLSELENLNIDKIRDMAHKPRTHLTTHFKNQISPPAARWFHQWIEVFEKKLAEKKTEFSSEDYKTFGVFPCVKRRLETGAPQGMRNRYSWQLASYFCKKGESLNNCLAMMRQWHQRVEDIHSYSWEECQTVVVSVYEKGGYNVGCFSEYVEGLCVGKDKCPLYIASEKPAMYDDETEAELNLALQTVLDAPNQLEALAFHLDNMVAGEYTTKRALVVLCLSAKCSEPGCKQMILLKGEPGGGKSNLAKYITLGYRVKDVGRFSSHALDYSDLEGFELLYLKELGQADDERGGVSTFKFVSSEDGGYLVEVTIKDEKTGRFTTEQRRVCPITTVSTTNRLFLDGQTERRAWVFGVDETVVQTGRIAKYLAKEVLQQAEKKLGRRKLSDSEFSGEVYCRFVGQFRPVSIIVAFPLTVLSVLDFGVLRVRGDMKKLLVFCEFYGMLNVKRLVCCSEGVFLLTPVVAFEALELVLATLANMLNRVEEREKAVFDALAVLGLDRAGQVLAQKEKQRIAEVLHKDSKTVRGYLNRLVERGFFGVEGSRNSKVFTLLADVVDIKEKLSCSSFKSCSNDDLMVRMVKEAQSNGYFLEETDVLWGGGLEKEIFVPAVHTEKISNDQQTINYTPNDKNSLNDRLMSVQTVVRPVFVVRRIRLGCRCDLCGVYAVEYELLTPLHDRIARCSSCYEKIKREYVNAEFRFVEPVLSPYPEEPRDT